MAMRKVMAMPEVTKRQAKVGVVRLEIHLPNTLSKSSRRTPGQGQCCAIKKFRLKTTLPVCSKKESR